MALYDPSSAVSPHCFHAEEAMMMHPLGHSNPSHLWSCTWEGEETFFVQWLLAQMEVQVSSLAMTEASLSVQLHLEGALVPPDPGNQGSSRMLWAFLDPIGGLYSAASDFSQETLVIHSLSFIRRSTWDKEDTSGKTWQGWGGHRAAGVPPDNPKTILQKRHTPSNS